MERSSVAPQSFLGYKGFRYARWLGAITVVSIGAYVWDDPIGGPSGGSWLGYGLGGVSAAGILWLMWFGIRKRQYAARGAPLRVWLSAHAYLGVSLLVLVPLHSGFQFGWNVHTLAFALMTATIATGLLGIAFYGLVPAPMTLNRPGVKLEALLQQIADIDFECRQAARELPDFFAAAVATAIEETTIGGSLFTQLRGEPRSCGTTLALGTIQDHDEDLDAKASDNARRLLELLTLKRALLVRVRRDLRFQALLDLWLIFHVPLAFATVAGVIVHVFVVFYYR
jgi:hypothetical protein